MSRLSLVSAISTLVVPLCATTALAATYVVEADGTGDFPTIQAAIDAVSDGDIIELADGVFSGPGNRDLDYLGLAITVRSQGGDPSASVIDAGGSEMNPHRGVHFHNNEGPTSVLQGIGIKNGDVTTDEPETYGGGIYCDAASPTIRNCRIWDSRAKFGGGIFTAPGASPEIRNCTILNNEATFSGGGIYFWTASSPRVLNCEITDNTAADYGGGIQVHDASGSIVDCVLERNSAGEGGGIGVRFDSDPLISGCTISNNSAVPIDPFTGNGGAISCHDGAKPTIVSCTMEWNTARFGGGIACVTDASPRISGCTIRKNRVSWSGGGIHMFGDSYPRIEKSIIEENDSGDWGGGVAVNLRSNLVVNTSIIRGNTATTNGGGIHIRESYASVSECIITGNTSRNGGGVFLQLGSTATASQSTISGNEGTLGGGVHCQGSSTLDLARTILWDNCVAGGGQGDEAYTDDGGSTISFLCSDVDATGIEGAGTINWLPDNIFSDPLFCDPVDCASAPTTVGDYHLVLHSPATHAPGCGLIGALGAGCKTPEHAVVLPAPAVHNPTGVPGGGTAPARYLLAQNQPNPFNPLTTIRFALPEAGPVLLTVHDVIGRQVAVVARGHFEAGEFAGQWDGRDETGKEVNSGSYFIRMEAGSFTATRKMVLLR